MITNRRFRERLETWKFSDLKKTESIISSISRQTFRMLSRWLQHYIKKVKHWKLNCVYQTYKQIKIRSIQSHFIF